MSKAANLIENPPPTISNLAAEVSNAMQRSETKAEATFWCEDGSGVFVECYPTGTPVFSEIFLPTNPNEPFVPLPDKPAKRRWWHRKTRG